MYLKKEDHEGIKHTLKYYQNNKETKEWKGNNNRGKIDFWKWEYYLKEMKSQSNG